MVSLSCGHSNPVKHSVGSVGLPKKLTSHSHLWRERWVEICYNQNMSRYLYFGLTKTRASKERCLR